MTTVFKQVGDNTQLSAVGEEDEVDIYFERTEGGDVRMRSTPLTMDLPPAASITDDESVYNPATGENDPGEIDWGNVLEEDGGDFVDVVVADVRAHTFYGPNGLREGELNPGTGDIVNGEISVAVDLEPDEVDVAVEVE